VQISVANTSSPGSLKAGQLLDTQDYAHKLSCVLDALGDDFLIIKRFVARSRAAYADRIRNLMAPGKPFGTSGSRTVYRIVCQWDDLCRHQYSQLTLMVGSPITVPVTLAEDILTGVSLAKLTRAISVRY